MIRKITSVKTNRFVLICQFSTGEIVEYDMSDVLRETGAIAIPLHDPAFFSKVFIEAGVPTWPNGYDICPDVIFKEGKKIPPTSVSEK